ncbi:hypothetical protein quinque_016330 [Culex quinquefasciatus]
MGGIAAVSAAVFTKGTRHPGNDHHQFYRLQDTVIEEDPEWFRNIRFPQQQNQRRRIPIHQELRFYSQSILQNVLWRKKLQDQRKMLFELAVESAVANPEVQQFVQLLPQHPAQPVAGAEPNGRLSEPVIRQLNVPRPCCPTRCISLYHRGRHVINSGWDHFGKASVTMNLN